MPSAAVRLMQTAAASGVSICFANPGTTEMPLVAALDEVPQVRAVLGLFEGVCTGCADGWGRMTGTPAFTLLHLGPGFANGVANLHNARRARSPIVNLVGDHTRAHRPHDAPLTSDIESLARPVSGWLQTASSPASLARDASLAISAASSPPGQIATLIIPADVQWEDCPGPVALSEPKPAQAVPPERVRAIAERIRQSQAPGLFLGGQALGVAGQRAARRVAEATGARLYAETFPARWERGGDLPTLERLAYFPEPARETLAAVDTLVLVDAPAPVSFFGYPGQPSELTPEGSPLSLCEPGEDAPGALEALADELAAPNSIASREKAPVPTEFDPVLQPTSVGQVLSARLPEGAIVVDEAATTGLPFYALSEAAAPHTVLSLTGGAIGQGLPCAAGAALACPDQKVIAFQADGSAQYTLQSLFTLARESLDVTVVLCSNRAYRILQIELARSGVTEPGKQARALTSLGDPELDWVSLARGYGVPAERVETTADFDTALRRALHEAGPHLIEVMI